MSKILCNQHGKTIAISACFHISKSIVEGDALKSVKVYEAFGGELWPHYLCNDCACLFALKDEQEFEELPEEVDKVMTMVCSSCALSRRSVK